MSHLKIVISLFILTLISIFVGCDDTPQISGPKSFVIGQHVTVELTKGEELIENDFVLVDADGHEYTESDPELEYKYIGKNNFSFRIPAGAADGSATMEIGSKGETYHLSITIYRGIVFSDGAGLMKMVGINSPSTLLKSASISVENTIIKLVDNHSSIVVLSPGSGQLDWFLVDSSDSSKFVLKIPSFKIETSTPGINANPKDVVASDPFLILATDAGVGTVKAQSFGVGSDISFENWISQGADFRAISKSQADTEETVLYAAVGEAEDHSSIMVWFDSEELWKATPQASMVTLSTAEGTVSDVSISQNGRYAAAVIPSESKIYLVEIAQATPAPISTDLNNCDNPTGLEFVNNSERIAVLCQSSGTVQLYNIAGTTANHFKTLDVGSSENRPSSIFHSSDGKIYISISNGGIEYFDATSSNPEVVTLPGSSSVNTNSFIIQP